MTEQGECARDARVTSVLVAAKGALVHNEDDRQEPVSQGDRNQIATGENCE